MSLTERGLRQMMRDKRYWNRRHPEHAVYVAQVTAGYRTLFAEDSAAAGGVTSDGRVRVRAYVQVREGKAVEVSGHERSAPAGSVDGNTADGGGPRDSGNESQEDVSPEPPWWGSLFRWYLERLRDSQRERVRQERERNPTPPPGGIRG